MAPIRSLLLITLISLSGLINPVSGAKILSVTFFSSVSQKLTILPLLEELGKRGHDVTVLTPLKPTKTMKNVKEYLTIDSEALSQEFMDKQDINPFKMKEEGNNTSIFTNLAWLMDLCRKTYDLPQVQDIMKEEFDVILIQPIFNECALGLVYRLEAPIILISPMGMGRADYVLERVGGHFPPSFLPFKYWDSGLEQDKTNFFQRSFIFWIGSNVLSSAFLKVMYEPAMEAVYWTKLGGDIPPVRQILPHASLTLSNGHFTLSRPKSNANLPHVVEVGGIHCKPAEPLPRELEDFVGGADDGLIYFSMGSAINGSTMPEEKRQIFRNVFSKLKQRVLWKWETETMADLPPNVKLSKWVPQQDVLGHENTKVFLTQCGGVSMEEAIFHGVPLVGLPMFDHHQLNAKRAKDHGFLVELDWNEVTEEKLSSAIQEVLNNQSYRDNVKGLSSLNHHHDQPEKLMNRAVYWVEYVVRNGHEEVDGRSSVGFRVLDPFRYIGINDTMKLYFFIIFVIFYYVFQGLRAVVRTAMKLRG